MGSREKILITVMTYPHPSESYRESVCTAGINESGQWIRLYPVDYRYQPRQNQFRKYQWIEADLEKTDTAKDNRPESYRPDLDTLRIVGEPLSTKIRWKERRDIIDAMPHRTVNQWRMQWDVDKTSLGIVRPKRVLDLEIRPADEKWKPKWEALFSQLMLFGPQQKPLRKLPYSFHYVFECEDSDKPHTAMCEDWELGVLFLNECERLGSEEKAAASVRRKFLDELCRDDKDTRFFMGTRFPFNAWMVLGVFWPPHDSQGKLF